jgi:hypothetical protein
MQLQTYVQLPHLLHLAILVETGEEDKFGCLSQMIESQNNVKLIDSKSFLSLEDETISRALFIGETTVPLKILLEGNIPKALDEALESITSVGNITQWQRQDWVFPTIVYLARRSGVLTMSVPPEELVWFLECENSGIPVNIDGLISELYSYELKDGVWTVVKTGE